jgi:hypothetical protein
MRYRVYFVFINKQDITVEAAKEQAKAIITDKVKPQRPATKYIII